MVAVYEAMPSLSYQERFGCHISTHLGFEAQPAEPIPLYLSKASRTYVMIAASSDKIQVIKKIHSEQVGLRSIYRSELGLVVTR